MHQCCCCVSKRMTKEALQQITRARLTVCEVGVFSRETSQLLKIRPPPSFRSHLSLSPMGVFSKKYSNCQISSIPQSQNEINREYYHCLATQRMTPNRCSIPAYARTLCMWMEGWIFEKVFYGTISEIFTISAIMTDIVWISFFCNIKPCTMSTHRCLLSILQCIWSG